MKRVFVLLIVGLLGAGMVAAQDVPITGNEVISAENADRLTGLAILGRGWVNQIGWSPDGRTLTVATSAGIWLYDAGDFQAEPRLIPGGDTWSLAYSPDGKWIAGGGSSGLVQVWDAATGDLLHRLEGPPSEVNSLAFSPDGTLLASVGGGVFLWDAATGERLSAFKETRQDRNEYLAFSPDGSLLATTTPYADDGLKLWNVQGRTLSLRSQIDSSALSMGFSEDSRVLVTVGRSGGVSLWDIATGEENYLLDIVTDPVSWWQPLVSSPDGPLVVGHNADSYDDGLINPVSEETVFDLEEQYGGISAAVSVDGKLAVAYYAGVLDVWDVKTGEQVVSLDEFNVGGLARGGAYIDYVSVTCLDFGPDNMLAAGMGGYMTDGGWTNLWDSSTGEIRNVLPGDGSMLDVAYNPDGTLLATANSMSGLRLWDMPEAENVRVLTEYEVYGVDFSPDGTLLAATDPDGAIELWDVKTGEMLAELMTQGWSPVMAYSPDGETIAIGTESGVIELWDVSDLAASYLRATLEGHTDSVTSLAFSPDGSLLVSASYWDDPTMRVWDVAGGIEIQTLAVEDRGMLAFSPDGSLLVKGGYDLRVWDVDDLVAGGKPLATYEVAGFPVFNNDGTLLAMTANGVIRLWGIR